jgi:hypothetical protein
MHHGDDRGAGLGGQFVERPEDGAHIGVAEAVDLAESEIGRDRVNHDQHHVADGGDLGAQHVEIVHQAEQAPSWRSGFRVVILHHLDDFDASEVGTGCRQPRHHRVGGVILGGETRGRCLAARILH